VRVREFADVNVVDVLSYKVLPFGLTPPQAKVGLATGIVEHIHVVVNVRGAMTEKKGIVYCRLEMIALT
jgi:hypothetical protein